MLVTFDETKEEFQPVRTRTRGCVNRSIYKRGQVNGNLAAEPKKIKMETRRS